MPPAVVLALLDSGVMALFILWLRIAWPLGTRASILPATAWIDSGGADAFRHSYRTVHLLLLGWLWLRARSLPPGERVVRWAHPAAALLVLAVHRALDLALAALPRAELIRWPIGS